MTKKTPKERTRKNKCEKNSNSFQTFVSPLLPACGKDMDQNVAVGVFDSGVGGLSVLRELEKAVPEARFVYYADTAHCPYGEKSAEYVLGRSREITEILIRKGVRVIVIACNTATSAAIATLRREYGTAPSARVLELTDGRLDHIPFIGMEPAVKPAALATRTGVVGVLATAGTLRGSKYIDMKDRWSDGIEIVESVGRGFVELVEGSGLADRYKKGCLFLSSVGECSGNAATGETLAVNGLQQPGEKTEVKPVTAAWNERLAEDIVRKSLAPLVEAGADTIVLGCTHYPFLLPVLENVAEELLAEHPLTGRDGSEVERIRFIDPAPAVAHRLIDILDRMK